MGIAGAMNSGWAKARSVQMGGVLDKRERQRRSEDEEKIGIIHETRKGSHGMKIINTGIESPNARD